MDKIVPVVMSGGSGTRMWPQSRALRPKQFVDLIGEQTLFQAAVTRLDSDRFADPVIVCNEEHRFVAAQQLQDEGRHAASIILEPEGRNTAPAIAVAALHAVDELNDPLLLVCSADHQIQQPEAFIEAVLNGVDSAESNQLVTFGIVPKIPETGYGYIKSSDQSNVSRVEKFVEKPDLKTAESYLADGSYYWNSGIFLFRASTYLKELETHHPEILSACTKAIKLSDNDLDFIRLNKEAFLNSPSDSIDYAVMEKTANATVVPVDCGWSDLGAWSAIWDISDKDADGNGHRGDVLFEACKNSYAHAGNRMVAMVGVENIAVIETPDAVLVTKMSDSQRIKNIVERLKEEGRDEATIHSRVYRPWGDYEGIDRGERYQVKRIVVQPGQILSLQLHHHRAEHWIVVSGTARITRGKDEFILTENESTYIPLGEVHRMENPGKIPLELIEVQSGSYLGEDDIVRLEDIYGRSEEPTDQSQ